MNYFKSPLSIGISLIIIGIVLIAVSIKKADRDLIKQSLLRKMFGDKTNRLISFITNIMFIALGVALIIFDKELKASVTIGLFFILIGFKSMTGEFSGKKDNFFEERFEEKTNFVIELIASMFLFLIGVSMIIWELFFK